MGGVEEVWRRYKGGEAIVGIAHAMGHCTTTVYKLLASRRWHCSGPAKTLGTGAESERARRRSPEGWPQG